MVFVGQAFLPENKVTQYFLTQDKFIYVFIAFNDALIFKITTQDSDLQTADEHYQLEDQLQ